MNEQKMAEIKPLSEDEVALVNGGLVPFVAGAVIVAKAAAPYVGGFVAGGAGAAAFILATEYYQKTFC